MNHLKRALSVSVAALIAVSGMCFPAANGVCAFDTAITASASEVITPRLRSGDICGDKLILFIDNAQSYSDSATFVIRVSGRKVKTMTGKVLKAAGGKVNLTSNGKEYIKPYTRYTVKATVSQNGSSSSSEIKLQTSKKAFYTVKKGTECYTLSGGSMRSAGTLAAGTFRGLLSSSDGQTVAGKSISSYTASYIKLAVPVKTSKNANNEQLYRYKYVYVKASQATRKSVESARNTVVNFALKATEVSDQTYALCGETFSTSRLYSDCSGLTKAAYLKLGNYLEHCAEDQANTSGKLVFDNIVQTGYDNGVKTYRMKNSSSRVDLSALEKGDLLFFLCKTNNQAVNPEYSNNGIGHVAMYVGDGKFVHFTASYGIYNHPCRIENLRNYESTQLPVVRVVRFIF